jgi:hypothetical protein
MDPCGLSIATPTNSGVKPAAIKHRQIILGQLAYFGLHRGRPSDGVCVVHLHQQFLRMNEVYQGNSVFRHRQMQLLVSFFLYQSCSFSSSPLSTLG